jgi:hypothetical protein
LIHPGLQNVSHICDPYPIATLEINLPFTINRSTPANVKLLQNIAIPCISQTMIDKFIKAKNMR